jgi:hypothetical protein
LSEGICFACHTRKALGRRLVYGKGYSVEPLSKNAKGEVTYRKIDDYTIELLWYE